MEKETAFDFQCSFIQVHLHINKCWFSNNSSISLFTSNVTYLTFTLEHNKNTTVIKSYQQHLSSILTVAIHYDIRILYYV